MTSSSSMTQISGPFIERSVSPAYAERRRILWRSCASVQGVKLTLIRSATLRDRVRGPRRCSSTRSSTPPAPARPSRTRPTRAAARSASCRSRPRRSSRASTPCSSPTCTATTSTTPRASCCRQAPAAVLPAAGHRAPARRRLHRRAPRVRRRDARRPPDRAHRGPARHGRDRRADGAGVRLRARRARRADASTSPATRSSATRSARRSPSYAPDVIVVNASAAQFNEGGPIVMDNDDVVALAREAPDAQIVAVHFETVSPQHRDARGPARAAAREGADRTSACPRTGRVLSRTRRGARTRPGWS